VHVGDSCCADCFCCQYFSEFFAKTVFCQYHIVSTKANAKFCAWMTISHCEHLADEK
jgi:hypothetical protein